MEWNVKNAVSRDVERQHLNKILAEIRASVSGVSSGGLTEERVLQLISASQGNVQVPAPRSITVTLTGDVEGTGSGATIIDIPTSVSNDFVREAPNSGTPYWRVAGSWEEVPYPLLTLAYNEVAGFTSFNTDTAEYVSRVLSGTAGNIVVTNGDGVLGDPVFNLATVPDTGTGALLAITKDSFGRITGSKAATITATAGQTTVTNGNAVAGLPTIGLADVGDDGTGVLQKTSFDSKGRKTGTADATSDDLEEGVIHLFLTEELRDKILTVDDKIDVDQLGVPGGVATLDGTGKVPIAQLPAYPTVPVTSVFGRTGAVTAATGDYTVAQVTGAAPLVSPALTGVPTAPTVAAATNSTQIATTAYVKSQGYTSNHAALSGLQGGAVGEYYHLTTAQLARIPPAGGTTGQFLRGDGTFTNILSGSVAYGGTTAGYAGFSTTVTVEGALHGALEVVSTRTDAPNVLIGAVSSNYRSANVNHQRIADIQFVTEGPTPGQRGGSVRFYVKPDASTALFPALQIHQDGAIGAGTDNVQSMGEAAFRWSVVYAGTGTINTSDAREKTAVTSLTPQELKAAIELADEIGTYKWLAMLEEKGPSARSHVGLTVQRAIEIMESNDLNPMKYGFICHDSWDAIDEMLDEVGGIVRESRPSGDRYAFRMDELLAFIARGLSHRMKNIEQRLAAAGL